ncbi:unnamed protein product [Bursaphelenchus okinawaensis]|uniref:Uncharacterized protein n=1 Tax=Bursaphelenchus okinawaensis TaxID=465554 RepID=A0A811JQN3_9BILA|nr:unnamed protein product [Bursaphelenchus okinawaensis]CAG9078132.1 unnamed protein product [Bursaphelenchus okinawaensis]
MGIFDLFEKKQDKMAANVTIDCFGEKLEVLIQNEEYAGSELVPEDGEQILKTVGDLRNRIAGHFGLVADKMKIIHRGQNGSQCHY